MTRKALLLAFLALAPTLGGCPIVVRPPGADQCPQRPTCEQCASQPECAWCVTTDARRGCFAETQTPTFCDPAVGVSDLCPDSELSGR